MNETVLNEVLEAYCDCRLPFEVAANRRNLNFRASEPVTVKEAKEIMERALGEDGGYNAFTPDILDNFPTDCEITLGREYSVAIYAKGANLPKPEAIKADEFSIENGWARYWWDWFLTNQKRKLGFTHELQAPK